MSGEIIGGYRVVRRLGQGGMGTVFEAVDTMLERQVALKVLRSEFAGEPELAERFRTEAIILGRLNHPHIATLYGLAREGDRLFMVMEFVRGETLDGILQREQRVPAATASRWTCQVLDAMAYAHRQGVVHRDIKPANLMVTEDDTIKVMDFGIARVLGSAHQTRHGQVIGTARYMSPEQIRGQDVDARTDIYALGVVLYQLVTGVTPFRGTDEFAVMSAHIHERPSPPSGLVAQLPAWLDAAILRALEKDPAARFPDAQAFRRCLEEGMQTGTGSSRVPAFAGADAASEVHQTTMLTPAPALGLSPAPPAESGVATPSAPDRAAVPPSLRSPLPHLATLSLVGLLILAGVSLAWFMASGRTTPGRVEQAGAAKAAGVQAAGGASPASAPVVQSPPPAVLPTAPARTTQPSGRPQPASSAAPGPVSTGQGTPSGLLPAVPPPTVPAEPKPAPSAAPAETPRRPAAAADEENAVEPDTFDVSWLRGTAMTDVVLSVYPDRLTLTTGDEKVLKSIPYSALSALRYAENRTGPGTRAGVGAVSRLFGGGKHWLTLQAGDEEIVLRVGRSYHDLFAVIEKASGRKVADVK